MAMDFEHMMSLSKHAPDKVSWTSYPYPRMVGLFAWCHDERTHEPMSDPINVQAELYYRPDQLPTEVEVDHLSDFASNPGSQTAVAHILERMTFTHDARHPGIVTHICFIELDLLTDALTPACWEIGMTHVHDPRVSGQLVVEPNWYWIHAMNPPRYPVPSFVMPF